MFSNIHIIIKWAGTGGNKTFAMEILKISAGRKKETIMKQLNYLNTGEYLKYTCVDIWCVRSLARKKKINWVRKKGTEGQRVTIGTQNGQVPLNCKQSASFDKQTCTVFTIFIICL